VGACSAVLSHLALRAENASSAEMPVVSAVVPVVPVFPLEYGAYVDTMQRDRAGDASDKDRLTLSHAQSRGVQTPGGIGRPDYRGMLQVQSADFLTFQTVELEPVEYGDYVSALQRHRAGKPMNLRLCDEVKAKLGDCMLIPQLGPQTRPGVWITGVDTPA
jgi:hypothetical protein